MPRFLIRDCLLPYLQRYKKKCTMKHCLLYIGIWIIITLGSTKAQAWLPAPEGGGSNATSDMMVIMNPPRQPLMSSYKFAIRMDGMVPIYRLQAGPFRTLNEAEMVVSTLNNIGQLDQTVTLTIDSSASGKEYFVKAGPWPSRSAANPTLHLIQSLGFRKVSIVTTDIPFAKAKAWKLPLTAYRQALAEASDRNNGSLAFVYRRGMELYSSDTFLALQNSIPYFAEIINRFPHSTESAQARYTIGKIYISMYGRLQKAHRMDQAKRKYYLEAAVDALNEFVTLYPSSQYADQALKQIGGCLHALAYNHMETLQNVAAVYKKLLINYPASSIAAEAQLQYAGILFELAINGEGVSWSTVRSELTKVQTLYPNANHIILSRETAMQAETYFFDKANYAQMVSSASSAMKAYPDVIADIALNKYNIGRANLDMGNYETAKAQFSELLTKDSDLTSPDLIFKAGLGGALFGEAICCYMLNDNTGCQSAVSQLINNSSYSDSTEAQIAKQWPNHLLPLPASYYTWWR
jgi:outer membrane protein assembly factor BamD (BamD/ComL family)